MRFPAGNSTNLGRLGKQPSVCATSSAKVQSENRRKLFRLAWSITRPTIYSEQQQKQK